MPKTKQISLWGGFVSEAVDKLPYVALQDKKNHDIIFLETEPQKTNGNFGDEMVIHVNEFKETRLLTITRPLARDMVREFKYAKLDINNLLGVQITIQRTGKGYTTSYTVTYEKTWDPDDLNL